LVKQIKQKKLTELPEYMKPFSVGFDILDLIEILKKYNISQKTGNAVINFYYGRKVSD